MHKKINIHIFSKAFLLMFIAIIFISCSNDNESVSPPTGSSPAPPTGNLDQSKEYTAIFDTQVGSFEIILYDDQVPFTVENFINLSRIGYYDQTTFHRVLPNFMAQGGDPSGTGMGNPGYKFNDEFHVDLRHNSEGILSMANSGANSNGSQFFITLQPVPFLDAYDESNNKKDCLNMTVSCHAVFGKVISGMDVVKKIRLREPSTDRELGTVINSISIKEK